MILLLWSLRALAETVDPCARSVDDEADWVARATCREQQYHAMVARDDPRAPDALWNAAETWKDLAGQIHAGHGLGAGPTDLSPAAFAQAAKGAWSASTALASQYPLHEHVGDATWNASKVLEWVVEELDARAPIAGVSTGCADLPVLRQALRAGLAPLMDELGPLPTTSCDVAADRSAVQGEIVRLLRSLIAHHPYHENVPAAWLTLGDLYYDARQLWMARLAYDRAAGSDLSHIFTQAGLGAALSSRAMEDEAGVFPRIWSTVSRLQDKPITGLDIDRQLQLLGETLAEEYVEGRLADRHCPAGADPACLVDIVGGLRLAPDPQGMPRALIMIETMAAHLGSGARSTGHDASAMALYRTLIEDHPDHLRLPRWTMEVAREQRATEQHVAAIGTLRELLAALGPDQPWAGARPENAAAREDDVKAASSLLRQMADERLVEARAYKGDSSRLEGRAVPNLRAAVDAYQALLPVSPTSLVAHELHNNLRLAWGLLDEAEPAWRAARACLVTAPSDGENRRPCLVDLAQFSRDHALALQAGAAPLPTDPRARSALTEPEEAFLTAVHRWLADWPEDPALANASRQALDLLVRRHELDRARPWLDEALRRAEGGAANIRREWVDALVLQLDPAEAADRLQALSDDPRFADLADQLRTERIHRLDLAGQQAAAAAPDAASRARVWGDAAERLGPVVEGSRAWGLAAEAWRAAGDEAGVADALLRVVEHPATEPDARLTAVQELGKLAEAAGRHEEAARWALRELDLVGGQDADLRFAAAEHLHLAGQEEQATATLGPLIQHPRSDLRFAAVHQMARWHEQADDRAGAIAAWQLLADDDDEGLRVASSLSRAWQASLAGDESALGPAWDEAGEVVIAMRERAAEGEELALVVWQVGWQVQAQLLQGPAEEALAATLPRAGDPMCDDTDRAASELPLAETREAFIADELAVMGALGPVASSATTVAPEALVAWTRLRIHLADEIAGSCIPAWADRVMADSLRQVWDQQAADIRTATAGEISGWLQDPQRQAVLDADADARAELERLHAELAGPPEVVAPPVEPPPPQPPPRGKPRGP